MNEAVVCLNFIYFPIASFQSNCYLVALVCCTWLSLQLKHTYFATTLASTVFCSPQILPDLLSASSIFIYISSVCSFVSKAMHTWCCTNDASAQNFSYFVTLKQNWAMVCLPKWINLQSLKFVQIFTTILLLVVHSWNNGKSYI